jgi:hypothetical protein
VDHDVSETHRDSSPLQPDQQVDQQTDQHPDQHLPENHDYLTQDESQSETVSASSVLQPVNHEDDYDTQPSHDVRDDSPQDIHDNADLLSTEAPYDDTVFHGDDGVVYRHSQM